MKGATERDRTQYVAGRNTVIELIARNASGIDKVLLSRNSGSSSLKELRRMATAAGVPVQHVPDTKLDQLAAGANHQGVVAVVSAIQFLDVDEMLGKISADLDSTKALKPMVVVLDGIEDPHNLGAIMRSIVACGAAGVVMPTKNMAPLNAHAVKTSAGTAMRIPVSRTKNLPAVLDSLKERGYWVVGADGNGTTTIWDMDWNRPIALVIGNEHRGMSDEIVDKCDYTVRIPIPGDVESLNASVAAGIILFAARTR